jgi:lysine 2,3-aminomutase
LLNFAPEELEKLRLQEPLLHIAITPYYLSLCDPANPKDPIRIQSVPTTEELSINDLDEDELGEEKQMPVAGLVHRYPDRVLCITTNQCRMNCRFCTRVREFANGKRPKTKEQLSAMLDYIRVHKEVRDVILSGGDALTIPLPILDRMLSELRKMPHVEMIRIGSRFPVVFPMGITDELCNMLEKYSPIWLNTHFNCPEEITSETVNIVKKLMKSGVIVSNQSVLLRGVNDTTERMTRLCQKLVAVGIRPLYLFSNDRKFLRCPIQTGIDIIGGMKGFTSGLAIPQYVVDLPGGGGKVSLNPNYVEYWDNKTLILRNYKGEKYRVEAE